MPRTLSSHPSEEVISNNPLLVEGIYQNADDRTSSIMEEPCNNPLLVERELPILPCNPCISWRAASNNPLLVEGEMPR